MYNLLKKENKMYEQLANIIKEYSYKKRLLDSFAFERIAEQIMKRKSKMRRFLVKINFENKDVSQYAYYNFECMAITLFLQKCYKTANKYFLEDDYIKKNEFLMSIFLHEINHAKQNMIGTGPRNDLESNIIRIAITLSEQTSYYKMQYKINPIERLSEIDANLQMYLIDMKINDKNSYDYFAKTESELYRGYSRFTLSPTEKFFDCSRLDYYTKYLLKEYIEYPRTIPFENKLRLGLAIKKEDLHKPLEPNLVLQRLRK